MQHRQSGRSLEWPDGFGPDRGLHGAQKRWGIGARSDLHAGCAGDFPLAEWRPASDAQRALRKRQSASSYGRRKLLHRPGPSRTRTRDGHERQPDPTRRVRSDCSHSSSPSCDLTLPRGAGTDLTWSKAARKLTLWRRLKVDPRGGTGAGRRCVDPSSPVVARAIIRRIRVAPAHASTQFAMASAAPGVTLVSRAEEQCGPKAGRLLLVA
jgi:hypothetical protein